jgi:hypothetical protein
MRYMYKSNFSIMWVYTKVGIAWEVLTKVTYVEFHDNLWKDTRNTELSPFGVMGKREFFLDKWD